MRLTSCLAFRPLAIVFLSLLSATQSSGEGILDNWHFRTNQILNRVKFAGGIFFGLGGDYSGSNGLLMTSLDGVTWTRRETGTDAALKGVAFGRIVPSSGSAQETYVVVGARGTILTSTNATNWTLVPTAYIVPTAHNCDLTDVAFLPLFARFVVSTVRRTADQPNVLLSGADSLWDGSYFGPPLLGPFWTGPITVAGQSLLAVGGDNIIKDIWRSDNGGVSWQSVTNSDSTGQGIAYGGGVVITVGVEGHGSVSRNSGRTWFYATNTFRYDMLSTDVAYGNGRFVVTRLFESLPLLSTADGMTWRTNNFTGQEMYSVAYGNGTFVIATEAGIYQSDSVLTPRIMTRWNPFPGWLVFTIPGEIGRGYRLQTSTDFATWSDFRAYTNTEPTMEIWAPAYSDPTQHFYRVVSP